MPSRGEHVITMRRVRVVSGVRVVSVPTDALDFSRDWRGPLAATAGKSFVARYTGWSDGTLLAEYLDADGLWRAGEEGAVIPELCWFVTE